MKGEAMSLDGAFRVLLSELPSVGLDAAEVCRAAGVDPRALAPGEVPLDAALLARLLRCAEEMAGDPLLVLRMAERAHARGVLSYLARSQRTVGDALEAFARHAAATWQVADAVRLEPAGRSTVVRFQLDRASPRQALEYLVARMAIALRREGVRVREVALRHAPAGPPEEYERVLRCPVRFRRPATQVVIATDDLARPLRGANPEAAAVLASALEAASAARSAPDTIAARLAKLVQDALARGVRPEREALARSLGMSGKTLARRLVAEGRSYRDVVDEVRRALALRLLATGERGKPPLALAEVAARAGFADLQALGKACRRWFGESPSALRARRRAS